MEEKLSIIREERPDFTLLKIAGRLDGYWSGFLDEYLDNLLKTGEYIVGLDLMGVHYMSSLGIRILIKYKKLYKQVSGGFGIVEASQNIEDLLKMAGLLAILRWQSSQKAPPAGESEKTIEEAGFIYKTSAIPVHQPMNCRFAGDPHKIRSGGYSADDCKTVNFGRNHYGIGLGAIGLNFEDCSGRFGEFMAIGDAVVYSPAGKSSTPDYMLKTGTLIPAVEMLYGIVFEGDFDKTVSFTSCATDDTVKFSQLITQLFRITGYEKFLMVMLAETSGLVGLSINKTPLADQNSLQNPFAFPEVKSSINFTTEPEYKNMMTITAGIATKTSDGELYEFTRPFSPDSPIRQHFHTAVFSYHPFKKSNNNLDETISALFEQDKILGVLHLINDAREFIGVGESDFKNGICWIGQIHS